MISTEPGFRCGNTADNVPSLSGRGGSSLHGEIPYSQKCAAVDPDIAAVNLRHHIPHLSLSWLFSSGGWRVLRAFGPRRRIMSKDLEGIELKMNANRHGSKMRDSCASRGPPSHAGRMFPSSPRLVTIAVLVQGNHWLFLGPKTGARASAVKLGHAWEQENRSLFSL